MKFTQAHQQHGGIFYDNHTDVTRCNVLNHEERPMQTIPPSKIPAFVRAISLEHNHAVMLWGPPGCGKSEIVGQFRDEGVVVVDIRLSQYDSVDMRGFPHIHKGTKNQPDQMFWAAPSTMPFVGNNLFPDDVPILLFLDEINSAQPSTLAVAYQLVNDRAVGEHKLKPNVRVVAAGNREGDKGVITKLPLPLANRMTHVEIVPDVQSWVDRHLAVGGDPMAAAFFRLKPTLINTFDPSKPSKAFGTYRSWSKAWAYCTDEDMPYDIRHAAIAGVVGDGEAAEMLAFVRLFDSLPDVDAILENPRSADVPAELDLCYALAVTMVERMSGHDVPLLENIATYLERLPTEIEAFAWLTKFRDKKDTSVICSSIGAKKAEQYWKVISSAA